jgi:transketolase
MSNERREEAKTLLSRTSYPLFPIKQFPFSPSNEDITNFAKQIRRDIILSTYAAGSGHPGGSLSSADLLSVLFLDVMRHRSNDPKWADRDYVIFSKGHVSPLLYSLLSETGYFPRELLATFRDFASPLQGHPSNLWLEPVEVSTGSLGQGLSVGVGLALALKKKQSDQRVYVLCGDGESQEGQIWEAVMSAAHYRLNHLTLIYDYNNLEIDGWVEDVMGVAPVKEKFEAFNWHVIETDGHSIPSIREAFSTSQRATERPSVLVARTNKGKGVSFMENQADWHGRAPNKEQMQQALDEIDKEELNHKC